MSFKDDYPDFAEVEHHIRRAHALRAVYLANAIASGIASFNRGLRNLLSAGGRKAADLRAVESDPFLKRSVPKY
jgi:hypothetical protein